jgi:hypothetical protein
VHTEVWLPPNDLLRWQDDGETGDERNRHLTLDAKELLAQVQLKDNQCHIALITLSELMKSQLLENGG